MCSNTSSPEKGVGFHTWEGVEYTHGKGGRWLGQRWWQGREHAEMVSAEWERKVGRQCNTQKNQYLLSTQSSGCHRNADSCNGPGEGGLVQSVSGLFGFKTSLQRLGAEGVSDLAADS